VMYFLVCHCSGTKSCGVSLHAGCCS